VTSASELGCCAGTSLERHNVKTLLVWAVNLSSNREVGSAVAAAVAVTATAPKLA